MWAVKDIIHPKMEVLSAFAQLRVFSKPYDFCGVPKVLCSITPFEIYEEYPGYIFSIMKVKEDCDEQTTILLFCNKVAIKLGN